MYVYVFFVLLILLCVLLFLVKIEYELLKIMRIRYDNSAQILFFLKKWDKRVEEEKFFLGNCLTLAGYKSIAVYGCGILGKRLVRELENSSVKVKYYIDKNAKNLHSEIPVFSAAEALCEVDVIIITVVSQFYEIKAELEKRNFCNIISLEDLI